MKTTTILLCAALLLGACGGNAARSRKSTAATRVTVPAAPREYTYRVKAVHPHATGRHLRDFRYPGEGWGLTTDGERLYLSDGTESIHVLDPETFRRERRITVTLEGEPVHFLNELEWIDGRIWANVYTTDQIVIIDPATGAVEGVVDLTGLLPDEDRTRQTDVLNGIAWDAAGGRIFVTGKNWPKLFEIEILPK